VSLDLLELGSIAAAAFCGALIYGLTGFGAGLVAVPIATQFVPLPFALALFVITDLSNALKIGFENPRIAVRGEWVRMVPGIAAGTALGATLLVSLPRQVASLALGVFISAFALYLLAGGIGTRARLARGWSYLAGFGGGLTSTLFGAGGPPYAMYLSQRGLSKEQFRATMGLATLASISLRMVAFFVTGMLLEPKIWLYALFAVPAAFAGIWLAARVFRRISRETLMRAVALALLAIGIGLLAKAGAG
jgi:uncharacterized membrane protein YfcA